MHTLDDLVTAGKVRYVGASNFSGLMKALALADRHGWTRYAAHQVQYSLAVRDARARAARARPGRRGDELDPLAGARADRQAAPRPGARRQPPRPAGRGRPTSTSRRTSSTSSRQGPAAASQLALNWLLRQPTSPALARSAHATRTSCATTSARPAGRSTRSQVARLDEVSRLPVPYPYNHRGEAHSRRGRPPERRRDERIHPDRGRPRPGAASCRCPPGRERWMTGSRQLGAGVSPAVRRELDALAPLRARHRGHGAARAARRTRPTPPAATWAAR